jgi:hypothetical protein
LARDFEKPPARHARLGWTDSHAAEGKGSGIAINKITATNHGNGHFGPVPGKTGAHLFADQKTRKVITDPTRVQSVKKHQ